MTRLPGSPPGHLHLRRGFELQSEGAVHYERLRSRAKAHVTAVVWPSRGVSIPVATLNATWLKAVAGGKAIMTVQSRPGKRDMLNELDLIDLILSRYNLTVVQVRVAGRWRRRWSCGGGWRAGGLVQAGTSAHCHCPDLLCSPHFGDSDLCRSLQTLCPNCRASTCLTDCVSFAVLPAVACL